MMMMRMILWHHLLTMRTTIWEINRVLMFNTVHGCSWFFHNFLELIDMHAYTYRYLICFPMLIAGCPEECTPYQPQAPSKSVQEEAPEVYASAEAASNQEVFGRDRGYMAAFPEGSPQAWYWVCFFKMLKIS